MEEKMVGARGFELCPLHPELPYFQRVTKTKNQCSHFVHRFIRKTTQEGKNSRRGKINQAPRKKVSSQEKRAMQILSESKIAESLSQFPLHFH